MRVSLKGMGLVVLAGAICAGVIAVFLSIGQLRMFLARVGSTGGAGAQEEAHVVVSSTMAPEVKELLLADVPAVEGASGERAVSTEDGLENQSPTSSPTVSGARLLLGIPASPSGRCDLLETFGVYAMAGIRDYGLPRTFSAEELKIIADEDDWGPAQYAYAEIIWTHLRWARRAAPGASPEALVEYSVKAIRKHNRRAASLLADYYYSTDKVESGAWWHVEQQMSAKALATPAGFRQFVFTDQELAAGVARADELINEHDLASALGGPEECMALRP